MQRDAQRVQLLPELIGFAAPLFSAVFLASATRARKLERQVVGAGKIKDKLYWDYLPRPWKKIPFFGFLFCFSSLYIHK